jgi:CHAT domain-containing protein
MPPEEAFDRLYGLKKEVSQEQLDEPAYGEPYHWAGFAFYGV